MPGQKFGQNFLVDKNIAHKIVNSTDINQNDTIIEIGPGKGILTELILQKTKKIIAVEIDKNLCNYLRRKFSNKKNIKIINSDFLKTKPIKRPVKFISNLPFCSATAIIEKIFKFWNWESAVFTFQKEVAERMLAKPNTKKYGFLTILVWFYSIPEKLFLIKRNCFYPVPEVETMVIKFTPKKHSENSKISEKFFKLIKIAFSTKRKTILNSLNLKIDIEKNILRDMLLNAGISPDSRPEEISPEKYLGLAIDFKDLF